MRPPTPYKRLTDTAREESLRAILAALPRANQAWVFAYGSLMWSPCFTYVECRTGTVYGYQRRLCVLSSRARGTPENPGLGLGLQPGDGDCQGIVYRLDPKNVDGDLKTLWEREMTSGIYQPHWLPVETRKGNVSAVAFVVDQSHPLYAGQLSQREMVEIIVQASGKYGPCREYLINTVRELAALGVSDPEFDALLVRVNART